MLVKFNFLSQALMEQTNVTMILPSWTLFDSGKGKARKLCTGHKISGFVSFAWRHWGRFRLHSFF